MDISDIELLHFQSRWSQLTMVSSPLLAPGGYVMLGNDSDPVVVSGGGGGNMTGDPAYILVPMTVLYSLIFVTGLVGNVTTCGVIVRNRHMHTATNYYLFSLAISDLLLLISGLPPEVYIMWFK